MAVCAGQMLSWAGREGRVQALEQLSEGTCLSEFTSAPSLVCHRCKAQVRGREVEQGAAVRPLMTSPGAEHSTVPGRKGRLGHGKE